MSTILTSHGFAVIVDSPTYPPPTSALVPIWLGYKYLEIHHTGGNVDQTPLEIDAEERAPEAASRGGPWSMIPYEFTVNQAGIDSQGRPLGYISGATFEENTDSIAICAIGNFDEIEPTNELLNGIIELGILVHLMYPTISMTEGHRDAGKRHGYGTACPGDNLEAKLPYIRQQIAAGVMSAKGV